MGLGDISNKPFSQEMEAEKLSFFSGKGRKTTRLASGSDTVVGKVAIKIVSESQFAEEQAKLARSSKRGLTRTFVPVILKNAQGEEMKVLVNINSAAKRLGVTKDSVYEAAKTEGGFAKLFEEQTRILMSCSQKIEGKNALTTKEAIQIAKFVAKHRVSVMQDSPKPVTLFYAHHELPRDLHITKEGKVIVHLTETQDSLIGSGGQKKVHYGVDIDTGQVKVITVEKLEDLPADEVIAMRQAAKKECELLEQLDSPYVMKIEGYIEEEDTGAIFASLPYYSEGALSDNLDKLNDRDRAQITLDILQGMKYLDEQGIIHRDIKPDNILLYKDKDNKDRLRAVIADFGFAISKEDAQKMMEGERKEVAGTEGFIAPEYNAELNLNHKSDMYSVGCTLYDIAEGLNQHTVPPPNGKFEKMLSKYEPDNPVRAAALLAIQENPEERLTASEILAKLEGHLQNKIEKPEED